MTHQSHGLYARVPADAGHRVAQLRRVLGLVEELAGRPAARAGGDAALAEAAELSGRYGNAEPIVQRRFDALAAETAAWSAAAAEALLGAGDDRSPAAAARLADELGGAIESLLKLLRN